MSYAQPKSSTRRLTALVAVGVFHVFLVYALIHGLARKIVEVVRPPLETKLIEEIKRPPPEQPPPPPPPPKLVTPPPPFIPPPEVQVQVPVQPPPTITAVVPTPPPAPIPPPAVPAPEPAPVAPPARTPAVVDARGCPKPSYPPASIRANETGVVTLNFLIDVDGRVLESKVERSSGHKRLDEAARAGLGTCKFKAATVDGRPERAWARIQYDWKLE
jgi:protein TonB